MSRFFPHTAYEEDQPLGRTILTTHVYYRGFQTGAFVGLATGSILSLLQLRRPLAHRAAWIPLALRSTGYGAAIGTALMVPALASRMYGREEIEWKGRSWRLLENEGQKEVDDWSFLGTVVGAVAAARQMVAHEALRPRVARGVGGAGTGSLAGVVGYMGWRYVLHGGKRGEVASA